MRYELIIPIAALVIMLAAFYFGYRREKAEWNGGVCAETGLPWEQFDTDSQGGRGYKSGKYYLWVSYPVDRV
jgi:hypothetical protein